MTDARRPNFPSIVGVVSPSIPCSERAAHQNVESGATLKHASRPASGKPFGSSVARFVRELPPARWRRCGRARRRGPAGARSSTRSYPLQDESPDFAVELAPDDKHVGNRRVGDPAFCAAHEESPVDRHGLCLHTPWIAAVVGLCQAKCPDFVARCCKVRRNKRWG